MCFVETAFKGNPTEPDLELHRHRGLLAAGDRHGRPVGGRGRRSASPTLEIYRAAFRPMRNILAGRDEKMLIKLVVDAETRLVLGAHILGPDAGEMAQLLGIALKAGLTKDDFDRTMAVHPTAAEELVTMYKPSYLVRDGERVGTA